MDISKHPLISDLQVPSINQEVPLGNNQAKDTAASQPEQMTKPRTSEFSKQAAGEQMSTANLELKTLASDTQKQEWQRERDQLLKTIASLKNKLEDSQAQLSVATSKPADNSVESRLKAVATGKQWYKSFTAAENQSATANVFKGWFNKTSEPAGLDSSNKALPTIDSVIEPSHVNQIEQLKVQLKNTEQELNEATSMLEKYRQETEKLESKLNFSRDEIEQQSLLLKNGEESKLLFQGELRKLMVENQKLAKELEQVKTDFAKPIEKALDSPDKLQTDNKGTKGTESKRQSVPIEKEVVTNLRNELVEAKQENVRLETTIEEIKCNYQFIVDSLTERDEKIKKQKSTIESLKSKIETLEQQSQKFDKEKEALNSSISTLNATISTKDQEIEELQDDLKKSKSRLDELITESQSLRDQVEIMKDKYEMSEQEHSISGKKATQLLKDLQKELKRKGPSVPEMSEYPNSILTTSFKPPVKEPSQGDLNLQAAQLQQQIEAMQKRSQYYEDELKEADQRIKLLTKELEQKSRLLQLYILKANQQDLITDKSKFNINQMSSVQTMQKMDSATLANINARMQKLLEEMTVKVMELELQLKAKDNK